MRQRYFGAIVGDKIILSTDDVSHCLRVMRMKKGDEIEVVYKNEVNLCRIESTKPFNLSLVSKINEKHELANKIILIVAVLKGEKMDLVLQKATELGVDEIVLLISKRTIQKLNNFRLDNKLERYRKILKEAAEQSKRVKIPNLHQLITFDQLAKIKGDVKMIAYEEASGNTASFIKAIKQINNGDTVVCLIGPEGGFEEEEVNTAINNGYQVVSLGRRILRAETASLYMMSVLACYLERK